MGLGGSKNDSEVGETGGKNETTKNEESAGNEVKKKKRRFKNDNSKKKMTNPIVATVTSETFDRMAIHSASHVMYPENYWTVDKGGPELVRLRRLVVGMGEYVDQLDAESEAIRANLEEMRRNLRDTDFGLGILKKAQDKTTRKMLKVHKSKKKCQVSPSDEWFKKSNADTQTGSLDELLILYSASHFMNGCESDPNTPRDKSRGDGMNLSQTEVQTIMSLLVSDHAGNFTINNELKAAKSMISVANQRMTTEERQRRQIRKWRGSKKSQSKFTRKVKEEIQSNYNFLATAVTIVLGSLFMMLCCAYLIYNSLWVFDKVTDLHNKAKDLVVNMCAKPTPIVNGFFKCHEFVPQGFKPRKAGYFPGTTCDFWCVDNYRPTDDTWLSECMSDGKWNFPQPQCKFMDCKDVFDRDCAGLQQKGMIKSPGLYELVQCRTFRKYKAYCETELEGGGWTVIQRRINGQVDFNRPMSNYTSGFGDPANDFWIGLENMNHITANTNQELMVRLRDWHFPTYHAYAGVARYYTFSVGDSSTGFQLQATEFDVSKTGVGVDTGDSLKTSNLMQFTSFDEDRDWNTASNCAEVLHAGWWHRNCTDANLNGVYSANSYGKHSIYWKTWRMYSALQYSEMLTRPKDFVV